MEHSSKYKTKGVRSSDPFQKESIPLNKISWEVSNDKKLISLTSFKFLQEKKYDDENLQLGIYAYDTANDFLLNKSVLNIKKETSDGLNLPPLKSNSDVKVIRLDVDKNTANMMNK